MSKKIIMDATSRLMQFGGLHEPRGWWSSGQRAADAVNLVWALIE
jgi:hypothetical protein